VCPRPTEGEIIERRILLRLRPIFMTYELARDVIAFTRRDRVHAIPTESITRALVVIPTNSRRKHSKLNSTRGPEISTGQEDQGAQVRVLSPRFARVEFMARTRNDDSPAKGITPDG
jgi:hypothetical protein